MKSGILNTGISNFSRFALIGAIGALVLLLVLPHFVASPYVMRLINLAGVYIIAVIGFNVLYGLCGLISFGQAGFFAIGAYAVGVSTVTYGLPAYVGFILAILLSTVFGLLVGFPTLRLKGHYLIVATIAFGEIVRQIALNWQPVTNGYDGLMGIPPFSFFGIPIAGDKAVYYVILAFVFVCLAAAESIKRSTYGRAMLAVKDGETAAEVMGINTTKVKILAFIVSALFGGLAGGLYAHLFGFISPDAFSAKLSTNIVAMLLIGGSGSNLGAAIGAVLVTFLPEWLRIGDRYYMLIYGLIFVLIVVFLPGGIIGWYQLLKRRIVRADQRVAAPKVS